MEQLVSLVPQFAVAFGVLAAALWWIKSTGSFARASDLRALQTTVETMRTTLGEVRDSVIRMEARRDGGRSSAPGD